VRPLVRGLPEKIAIDKSGANTAAIRSGNDDACLEIELRQSKYLNSIMEQGHRAVKRVTDPMRGFKSFLNAQRLIMEYARARVPARCRSRHHQGQQVLFGTGRMA
jgi:transposase-like protein